MFKKIKRYYYYFTHPIKGEIWELHKVRRKRSSNPKLSLYEITPQRLESLILQYKKKGYQFVSIDDVMSLVDERISSPKKFISITLDDGYEDNLIEAYPIFKKYNIPFCIYIVKDYIKNQNVTLHGESFKMLSEDQLQNLSKDPLCTLGVHTCNHSRLSQLDDNEQFNQIYNCKIWLEQLTQKTIFTFSYPYGDFNELTVKILKSLNFKNAVESWGGGIREINNAYKLPRLLVDERYKH